MNYQSTRNAALTASSAEAILNGPCPRRRAVRHASPRGAGLRLAALPDALHAGHGDGDISALLPSFTHAEMEQLAHAAYTGKFETEDLTPTVPVGEDTVLELFRGPTSAFKDVALSMLPHLMTAANEGSAVWTMRS